MTQAICEYCTEPYNDKLRACPHCARPSKFPNMVHAKKSVEIEALNNRYDQMVGDLKAAGLTQELNYIEQHLKKSDACKAMPRWEIERLANSETSAIGTYYQQIEGQVRLPDDNRWDRLRRIADASFFECYGTDINFAALSTNWKWLSNYGDGAVFFKDEMISHRSTVFETNTALWVEENNCTMSIPSGSLATWDNRVKLGVAKLGGKLRIGDHHFDDLILLNGADSAGDAFMEVHICGGFTIRSTKAIIIKSDYLSAAGRLALNDRAKQLGFKVLETK